MARLLLADRVKGEADSFLAPLRAALAARHDVRFVSAAPGPVLAEAITWAEIVWLEWCWDHAVWATTSGVLGDRACIVRAHSIELLQTDFPDRVDWSRVDRAIVVGPDAAGLLAARCPAIPRARVRMIPNGIDLSRFRPGSPDRRRVAWVGHVEPKKNPMLLLQIARTAVARDPSLSFHVAGAATDLRTARYLQHLLPRLGLAEHVFFEGHVRDMGDWYADKGVLLSTTLYESFGLNIGEGMAAGAFPVLHDFPGAADLWPQECLFADIDEAVSLILAARTGLYRGWVADRYALDRQAGAVLALLEEVEG